MPLPPAHASRDDMVDVSDQDAPAPSRGTDLSLTMPLEATMLVYVCAH